MGGSDGVESPATGADADATSTGGTDADSTSPAASPDAPPSGAPEAPQSERSPEPSPPEESDRRSDESSPDGPPDGPPDVPPDAPDESSVREAEVVGADGTKQADGGTRSSNESSGATERVTLRITEDVGRIFGVDEREYDLETEDVVTLPTTNAGPLLDRDAAERLD
jgi:DNA replication factor GINS